MTVRQRVPIRRRRLATLVAVGLLAVAAAPGAARALEPGAVAFATWEAPVGLSVQGDLDGVGVGFEVSRSLDSVVDDGLSGPNYNPSAPAPAPVVVFSANSRVTISFDGPVTNLLLYTVSLRRATYTLTATGGSGSWSVQSGLEGFTLDGPGGNVLTPPGDPVGSFTDGVLRFSGTLTGLEIASSAEGTENFSQMGYTLALLGVEPTPVTTTPTTPLTTAPTSTVPADPTAVAPRYTG